MFSLLEPVLSRRRINERCEECVELVALAVVNHKHHPNNGVLASTSPTVREDRASLAEGGAAVESTSSVTVKATSCELIAPVTVSDIARAVFTMAANLASRFTLALHFLGTFIAFWVIARFWWLGERTGQFNTAFHAHAALGVL